jgi:hypothetical protein
MPTEALTVAAGVGRVILGVVVGTGAGLWLEATGLCAAESLWVVIVAQYVAMFAEALAAATRDAYAVEDVASPP